MALKILNILACYNSLDIIPYVLEYNQKEGIDSFVMDNYSDDGSWEYLQFLNVPSNRLDTGGAFHTTKIQAAKMEVIQELKPDWVIRGSSDHFFLTPDSVRASIEQADKDGCNAISMPIGRMCNTGEDAHGDPRKTYFYYFIVRDMIAAHKTEGLDLGSREQIKIAGMKQKEIPNSLLLDYGNTRSAEKRDEEYDRRKLAWEHGEPKGHGIHYAPASKQGWLWDKDTLLDIRESEYWQTLCDRFGDI